MHWLELSLLATIVWAVLALTLAICVRLAAGPLVDAVLRLREAFHRRP
jgi:hypothetical protein